MTINVGEAKYEDAETCLRDLIRMIRVGFPLDMTRVEADQKKAGSHTAKVLTKQKRQIEATISALRKEVTTNRALSETDRLRLVTLEAEFYQQHGNHSECIRVLEPEWKRLKRRLDESGEHKRFEPSGNRVLLRQQIWALLHYVFYHDYRLTGQHKSALDHFLSIERIIHSELETPDYCPYGTLALCNYFIGLCYRVNRGFVEAERRLLAAQQFTHERVKREIERTDTTLQKKQYEIAYKDVFCARILFSLGWVAFQQGQLWRAEQHLRTAQNCLVQKAHWLGILVDSLLWMTVRRRAAYDHPDYLISLRELSQKWAETSGFHDLNKQRVAFELVRGYLDLAEFGSADKADRDYNLNLAQQWLGKVGEPPNAKAKQRYDLHSVRLLIVKGDIETAEETLLEVRKTLAKGPQHQRQRAVRIMEAALYIRQEDFDTAIATVKKALEEILPVASSETLSGYRIPDPVLESECYVLLARIYSLRKDYPAARHYLSQWSLLSQFVDNHYLHHMVKTVVNKEMPFQLDAEYEIFDKSGKVIKTIPSRVESFERWLITNAEARGLSRKDLDKMYDMDPSTVSRRKKKLFQDRE